MKFADLIDRVKSAPYNLSGIYFLSSPPYDAFPLRIDFEFVRDDDALVIQGCIQGHAHEVPETFMVRIPFNTMSMNSAWATLSTKQLGDLEGRIVSTGENFEFLVSSPQHNLCSAHLYFTGHHEFEVSGMLTIEQHSVAFAIKDQSKWEHALQAKVVSMLGREK